MTQATQFLITPETVRKLERRKTDLQSEISRLSAEYERVCRQLEAIPLFLNAGDGDGNTTISPDTAHIWAQTLPPTVVISEPPESGDQLSLPSVVVRLLQKRGRLTTLEIREGMLREGVPRERLGATNSYLYTVLGRLVARKRVQRVRGKYQLPSAVTVGQKDSEAKNL
jgi:hypothetical protein